MSIIIFIFGLTIGSFLNAVIYRLHTGEPIIKGRSHCPKCGHILAWYELVPVLSFLIQKARCKECGKAISFQYPLVEIATASIFLLIFNYLYPRPEGAGDGILELLYFLTIFSLLIIIFVYDLKHYIIPDKIIYPAIILVLLYHVFGILAFGNWDLIQNSKFEIQNLEILLNPLYSAALSFLFFASIYFVSRGKWMGFGDVKLAFFMGLFLGWPNILVALFIAFILGGIIGILLIAASKKSFKSQVPFGPFLVAGTFVAMFWGKELIRWYLGFIT